MRLANSASQRRRLTVGIASAAVLLLAVSACGSSSNGSSGTSSNNNTKAAIDAAPAGTFAGKAATGSEIKIGIIVPEGGATISEPEARVAAQAAIDYANENLGGIGGHKITPVICKNAEDPASSTDCANQMVEQKVAGVVVLDTANGTAMAPIITKAGIAYTSYQGASPEELTGNPSFLWTGGFPGVLVGMAKYAASNQMKSLTLFVTDAPAVVGGAKAFGAPAFKAAGVKLNVVPIPPGTPDATPQVSAGVKDKPGAVGIVGDATMCTSTLKALGTVGYQGDKLAITQCLDPSVQQAAGDVLKGTKIMGTADGSSNDPEAKVYRAVMAKYAPKGATLTGAAQTGFQSMLGFIRGAASATDATAPAVVAALKSAKDVVLPLGHGATFTCDGKALPGLSAVCSDTVILGTWNGSTLADPTLLP